MRKCVLDILAIHLVLLICLIATFEITAAVVDGGRNENGRGGDAEDLQVQSNRNNEIVMPVANPTPEPTTLPPTAAQPTVLNLSPIQPAIVTNADEQPRAVQIGGDAQAQSGVLGIGRTNIAQTIRNRIIKNLYDESRRLVSSKPAAFATKNTKIAQHKLRAVESMQTPQPNEPRGVNEATIDEKISTISAIRIFFLSITGTIYLIYRTASLFSKGFYSTKFYKGGGSLVILTAIGGNALGALLGWIFWHNFTVSLVLGSPLMCLFVAAILMGPRGACIGCYGGGSLGFTLSNLLCGGEDTWAASLAGIVVGSSCGFLIGLAPVFSHLKINQRYIRKRIMEGSGA